jgi:hypothetical protein
MLCCELGILSTTFILIASDIQDHEERSQAATAQLRADLAFAVISLFLSMTSFVMTIVGIRVDKILRKVAGSVAIVTKFRSSPKPEISSFGMAHKGSVVPVGHPTCNAMENDTTLTF